jgi:hypothetical protein
MRIAIIAAIVMLVAIVGAVALMRGPEDSPETYTTEAYVMAVGERSINICEREEPINPATIKVFDIDGNPVDLGALIPPFQAVLTMGYQGDQPVVKELRVQIQYRINEEGRVEEERRADVM